MPHRGLHWHEFLFLLLQDLQFGLQPCQRHFLDVFPAFDMLRFLQHLSLLQLTSISVHISRCIHQNLHFDFSYVLLSHLFMPLRLLARNAVLSRHRAPDLHWKTSRTAQTVAHPMPACRTHTAVAGSFHHACCISVEHTVDDLQVPPNHSFLPLMTGSCLSIVVMLSFCGMKTWCVCAT